MLFVRTIFVLMATILLEIDICYSSQGIKYGDVKINEINPDPPEWVELINTSGRILNIKGCFLSDGDNIFEIKKHQTLEPNEITIIDAPEGYGGKWPRNDGKKPWGFSKKRLEAAILLDPNQQKVIDFIFKPKQTKGYKTFGRYPDGTDELHFFGTETKDYQNIRGKEYHVPPPPPTLSYWDYIRGFFVLSWGKVTIIVGFLSTGLTAYSIIKKIVKWFPNLSRKEGQKQKGCC